MQFRCVTSFLVVVVVCIGAICTATAVAVPPVGPEVLFGNAALLSGGLGGCPTYNASTCTLGIAAFVARRRALTAQGIRTLPLPAIQRTSVFTKTHPLDWGVNFDILPGLGISTGVSATSFSTRHYAMSYQQHDAWHGIIDQFTFPAGHAMQRFLKSTHLDPVTRVQVLPARLSTTSISDVAAAVADSLFGATTLGNGYVVHSLVLVYDTTPIEMLGALRTAAAALAATVDLTPTIICKLNGGVDNVTRVNGTWLVELKLTRDVMHRLRIHEDPTDTSRAVDVTVLREPLHLPPSMIETPEYRRDQALIKIEHDRAVANNPFMGTIAGPMPAPVTVAEGNVCMHRECASGDLFSDAIREAAGTDIALFSGPWLTGSGWPEGNVTLQDLYGMYAYTEQLAKGTYLGVTIFELLNHTIAESAFDPRLNFNTYGARHLMQVSGLRVAYTFGRDRNDRLVSIDVYDQKTARFEPLERLKYYTVACDSFLGRSGLITKQYLRDGRYAGELGMALLSQDLHRAVGAFITARGGSYTPGLDGRMANVTSSGTAVASMQHWDHVGSGCSAGMILNMSIGTCTSCPAGLVPDPSSARCVAVPSTPPLSSEVRMALIALSVVIVIIAAVVSVKGFSMWRRHQRLRYCPRDSAAPIAAFFVTVRNDVAVRERHPSGVDEALRRIERIVVESAPMHGCYVAKKLKAHFLVVAKEPTSAVRCAAAIHRAVEAESWAELSSPLPVDAMNAQHARASGPRLRGRSSAVRRSRHSVPSSRVSPSGSVSSRSAVSKTPRGKSISVGIDHSSDHSSTYRRTPRADVVPPSVSIGLAFGHGRVEYDDEVDVFSYTGPVLDTAVTIADLAHGGQVLATEAVVSAAGGACAAAVEFEDFTSRSMPCPLSGKDSDVTLSQANVTGCPHRIFEAKTSDSDEAAGALAAALETASGGLTARRIGVATWTIPALRGGKETFASRAEHMRASEDVLFALRSVCGNDSLLSSADGCFAAVVNGASVRTAQVAAATVELGRAGLRVLDDVTEHRAACGVSVGTSVAGTAGVDVLIAGVVGERARLLAMAAFNHNACPEMLVSEDAVAELEGYYALAAVDVITWPTHCRSASTALPLRTKSNDATSALVPVYVADEGAKAEDDEWLYQLEAAANGNPHTALNNALFAAIGRTTTAVAFETPAVSPLSVPADNGPADHAPAAGPKAMNDRYGVRALTKRIADFTSDAETKRSGSEHGQDGSPNSESQSPLCVFAQRRTKELCFRF